MRNSSTCVCVCVQVFACARNGEKGMYLIQVRVCMGIWVRARVMCMSA